MPPTPSSTNACLNRPLISSVLTVLLSCAVPMMARAQQSAPAPHATPGQKFRIAGTVTNAVTGEPLPRTRVTIGEAEGTDTLQSMTTGDDGRFEFDGLDPMKYWLRAERTGFSSQAYEEHRGFFTAIVTGRGFDTEHLVFRLRPDAEITGEIVDDASEAVRDAQVLLFVRETQNGRETTTEHGQVNANDEGRFRFGHLPPGTYFVAVVAKPWYSEEDASPVFVERSNAGQGEPAGAVVTDASSEPEPADPQPPPSALDVAYPVTYFSGATEPEDATPIVLKPGDRATADIRLNPLPALHLKVLMPAAQPGDYWGASLTLRLFDSTQLAMPAQINGGQNENDISGIPPGDYEISVQSYGKNPRGWTQDLSAKNDAELRIDENTTAQSPSVRGTVRLDGSPVTQGYVSLLNRSTGLRVGQQISDKGEFELPVQGLKAGSYEVSVFNVSGAVVSGISATGAKVTGQNVAIGASGTVDLTITLARGLGRVEGVVLRDSKPLSGAMVVLVPPDPVNQDPLFRRDQSDLDGTFALRDVLPGQYTLIAVQDAWDLDWSNPDALRTWLRNGESVKVVPGGKQSVKVTAQPALASPR